VITREAAEDDARLAVYQLLAEQITLPYPYVVGQPANRQVPVLDDAAGALPYVALGSSWELPDDDHDGPGALVVVSVHTWSDYAGFAELGALNRAAVRLLDRPAAVPDALAAYDPKQTSVKVTATRSMRDEDTRFRHGVIDVTVRLKQVED
jgi:hypothetical protein